jgi:hypothetical protein
VVDHLDAIARSVCDEDPPGFRLEGGVVKLAACGFWHAMVPAIFSG